MDGIILFSIWNLICHPNSNDDQTNEEENSLELTEVEVEGTPKDDQILELKKQIDHTVQDKRFIDFQIWQVFLAKSSCYVSIQVHE